ncbi:rhomboid family intramembrane serine protease [Chloroflexota bacterium]
MAYKVTFRNQQGFRLGPIEFLVIANLLMFIVTLIRPELRFSLGLNRLLFPDRPWTLLTSMFVHAGFWHIFANMFTLYFFGRYVHMLVGEGKFLIVYFLGGLLGGSLYLLMAGPYSFAVGASGAVFAVAGVLTVMRPRMTVFIFPIPVPIPLWVAVIGGFLLLSFASMVAWQAHLGGLVFGLVSAYFFKRGGRRFL